MHVYAGLFLSVHADNLHEYSLTFTCPIFVKEKKEPAWTESINGPTYFQEQLQSKCVIDSAVDNHKVTYGLGSHRSGGAVFDELQSPQQQHC